MSNLTQSLKSERRQLKQFQELIRQSVQAQTPSIDEIDLSGSSGKGGSTGDAGTGTNGSRLQATQSCIDYGSMDLDELIMERTNFATGAITRTRAILDRLTNFMVSLIY